MWGLGVGGWGFADLIRGGVVEDFQKAFQQAGVDADLW